MSNPVIRPVSPAQRPSGAPTSDPTPAQEAAMLFPLTFHPLRFATHLTARFFVAIGGLTLALYSLQLSAQALNQPAPQPYRTIETQQIRPNVQLIIDKSGSMTWSMDGYCGSGAFKDTGCIPEERVAPVWVCVADGCAGTRRRWAHVGPSRMAILKNVLGDDVSLTNFSGTLVNTAGATTTPRFGTACTNGTTNATNPSVSGQTCGGTVRPSTTTTALPVRLINTNSLKMNVGLENFADFSSGGSGSTANSQVLMNTSATPGTCERDQVIAFFKAPGVNTTVTSCSPSVAVTAFTNGNGTPAQAALNLSSLVHRAVAFGTAQTGNICPLGGGSTRTVNPPAIGADPQRSCNRPLFNLHVTDGESNNCNPGDSSISYGACVNGITTPAANSPATRTNALFNSNNNQGANLSVRTFVIGVSTDLTTANAVNELNQMAFFGRTDANDPYQLAGLKLSQAFSAAGVAQCQTGAGAPGPCSVTNDIPFTHPADPYLRTPAQYVIGDAINSTGLIAPATVACITLANGLRICGGAGYQCNHTYYYVATSQAQLAAGLKSAFDAVAAGDYTTETPSIAQAVTAGGVNAQDLIYTASSEFPSYYGHLRAQDLNQCVDVTGTPVICSLDTAVGFRVLWDAGAEMNDAVNPTSARRIFTASPNAALNAPTAPDNVSYMTLTPVNSANLGTLQSIYGSVNCGAALCSAAQMTSQVVDFMRGNDGNGVARAWKLGDIVNSAPVVLAPPSAFRLSTTANHTSFTVQFSGRRPLILVGASDGMVHAFDAGFGFEVWAFIPPDALPRLVQEYANFSAPGASLPMGQTTDTATHLFGVASAINIGDVDLNAPEASITCTGPTCLSTPATQWRTLAVSGMGKGGTAVFALDVTSSFTGRTYKGTTLVDDPIVNTYKTAPNNAGAPFKLLWYKNASSTGFSGLGDTWSSPAISLDNYTINAPTTPTATAVTGRWVISFGSGPAPDTISCPAPGPCPPQPTLATPVGNVGYTRGVKVYAVSARDGSFLSAASGIQLGASDTGALMAATMKANNATYSTETINFVDQSIDKIYQASTGGQLWEIDATNPNAALWTNAPIFSDSTQPIYNSPAIGFYKDNYTGCLGNGCFRRISIHAWASGDFAESSKAINNLLCGTAGQPACFTQRMFISLNDYQPLAPDPTTPALTLLGRQTTPFDLTGMTYQLSATDTTLRTYSRHARILGSPSIFIPVILNEYNNKVAVWPSARDVTVLFTAYDPTQGGCIGESSFLVFKPFGLNNNAVGGSGYNLPAKTYGQLAAAGVASSPIIYKGNIIMNVSSKYSFAAARIAGRDTIGPPPGGDDPILGAWREVF